MQYYIHNPQAPNYDLIKVLFNLREPYDDKNQPPVEVKKWFDTTLNEYQHLAVERGLSCQYYSLIHGPPGTGKTKTVCEVIQQLCERKKKVLVTAASNIAVDNIIERLEYLKSSFKIIRIGNPTRTLE
jgi:DNA polymerase alpha-associated DNA helicase A